MKLLVYEGDPALTLSQDSSVVSGQSFPSQACPTTIAMAARCTSRNDQLIDPAPTAQVSGNDDDQSPDYKEDHAKVQVRTASARNWYGTEPYP